MKYNSLFQTNLGCADDRQVFDYLMNNLVEFITYWDYFVSWPKAQNSLKKWEVGLNTLNYLVGKADPAAELRFLLTEQPNLVALIPVLVASSRYKKFTVLTDHQNFTYENFSFLPQNNLTAAEVDKVCRFAKETGLLEMFGNGSIKSVPDYVFGVEVGLGSNGRKNRSGTRMQEIVRGLLTAICAINKFDLLEQVKPKQIKTQWGFDLKIKKANKIFDFAIKANDKLYLIETNYYGGGGSKLKATAGEYTQLYDNLKEQSHNFIWITDGIGWKSARNPLEDAFFHIDHVLNLKMVTAGLLQAILTGAA